MKATLILTSLFAAFVAASPVDVQARQRPGRIPTGPGPVVPTIRVLLADDATDTAVQANIAANGQPISIADNFGNLGADVPANRAGIVTGNGMCQIFSDPNANQLVATIVSGGDDVEFDRVDLVNGVIICQ